MLKPHEIYRFMYIPNARLTWRSTNF